MREYPYGELLAHLVGYIGAIPSETKEKLQAELDRLNEGRTERDGLYNADSRVGRLGLEQQYEQELRGRDGELVYICTAEGTNRKTLYKIDAQDGYDIELTIDMDLQRRVQEVMQLALFGETTAGAVVALASAVTYILTEGRVDAERVKTAADAVQAAADALEASTGEK